MPTISAVIPNYNHQDYLESALDHHLSQTHPILEAIFVDDGSTDESLALLRRLEQRHAVVRVLAHDRNQGVNAAIMTGLAAARGDYVRLGSTNDPMQPDFFSLAIGLLERHPEAGLFFANPATIDEAGTETRRLSLGLADQPIFLDPPTLIRRMAIKAFSIPSQTMVFRRSALEAVGGFRPDLHWHADWFAKTAVALRGGACHAPVYVAAARDHADAYSVRTTRSAEGERSLLYRILDILAEPDFADIAERVAEAGVFPELRLRTLHWLAARRSARRFLSGRLVARCVMEEVWTHLRPLTPMSWRQVGRAWASRLTR